MKRYEVQGTVLLYCGAENEKEAIDEFMSRMREAFAYLIVDENLKVVEA